MPDFFLRPQTSITITTPWLVPLPLPKSIWLSIRGAGVHEPTYRILPLLDQGVEPRRSAMDLLDVDE